VNKILHIAIREFLSTAMTKGFIIGAFVVPAVILVLIAILFPLLLNQEGPKVEGDLAVIDRSGVVGEQIADRLEPEAVRQRAREQMDAAAEQLSSKLGMSPETAKLATASAVSQGDSGATIHVDLLAPDADPEVEKQPLKEGKVRDGGRLALAVIDENAVAKSADSDEFGGYELFVKPKLDDRVQDRMHDAIAESIRERRLRRAGLDPENVEALTHVRRPPTTEVSEKGERASLGEMNMLISFGFMFVIFLSVMIGGQYLLTTVVEEKASRVVEVLLSAVSPMQLMSGKIIGQLGVGLTMMLIYGGLGGGALIAFKMGDLIGVVNVVYLIVFFLIAYFIIASMMAAVGSAVNELREAQSLMTPIMVVMMVPYILWMPITRNPSSPFSVTVSFVPFVSPFAMVLRITSNEPPPTWQVLLAILIGVVSVYVSLWAAAKIFRIGLLMFGKPPNFATLIRWVRMA